MAAPNILNLSSIVGVTTMVNIANAEASNVIISNSSSSNSAYRINSIIASNIDGTDAAWVSVKITNSAAGAGTSFPIADTITVPADSTLVVLGKDAPIYLEEDRSIIAIAQNADDICIVASYEVIS